MDSSNMKIIIDSILTIIGILLTTYVIPYLKEKAGEQKLNTIREYAEVGVRAAEKLFEVEEFKQKKIYVMDLVSKKCTELGYELTTDDIEAIVESCVQFVKGA